jgi:hypothetical protein
LSLLAGVGGLGALASACSGGTTGAGPGELDGAVLEDGGPDSTDPGFEVGDDTATCTRLTCATAGANCGPIGDGCGGVIDDCGSCPAGQVCGGGGKPSVCGTNVNDGGGCLPLTCATAGANCGPIGDGCGGTLDCGTCPSGQSCGAGGTPSVCGIAGFIPADGGVVSEAGLCIPRTCADAGANCGKIGDGCGGVVDCGACSGTDVCGGSGKPNICGNSFAYPDGATCAPRTCADVGANCGPVGDGCGGLLDCGTCKTPYTCGGGGTPSVCGNKFVDADGGIIGCTKKTCASIGANCGPVADGCGGLLACGTCSSPYICGGGGTPNRCGNPFVSDSGLACTPKTCADLNANCGLAGDGCGGTINCGSCSFPDICGGGGVPSRCGGSTVDAGSTSCTGLCAQQIACPGTGVTTTITGTVFAPTDTAKFGAADPLYGATVYIPKSGVPKAFGTTVTCDTCGGGGSIDALVSAVTGSDGTFKLQNVPVGTNIPIVIELGKWRRFYTIPNVAPCVNTPLPATATRLPRKQHEFNTYDNIPKMAFATGAVDALECVLRKIGVDDSEFTNAAGTGRVHIYKGDGAAGASVAGATGEAALTGSLTTLKNYDVVLLPCQGARYATSHGTATQRQNLIDYTSAGGRVFATHFSYIWLYNTSPFSGTANWSVDQTDPADQTGYIDTSFYKGQQLANWLLQVKASTTLGQIPLQVIRHDYNGAVAPSQSWMTIKNPANTSVHYTFNTPVGKPADSQCGRVLFDDYHVENASSGGKTFPNECSNTPMTPQEKLLEFMIFDLSSCLSSDNTPPPPPPTCTTRTCADQKATCGRVADGCGSLTGDCGTCGPGTTCGGAGVPNTCGGPTCTPFDCAKQGFNCGVAGDGCGKTINCGTCTGTDTCGGAGVPNVCGHPTCTPRSCADVGATCGSAGDGCGGTLSCGSCTLPFTCGGGGKASVCGGPTCTPKTCADLGATCGWIGDGCGGTVNCGDCTAPDTCGGGGIPSTCGHTTSTTCKPRTCTDAGAECGAAADGCGGLLDCGTCVAPKTCGGGGTPFKCGAPTCTPRTCSDAGANCGKVADGCGGLLDCGSCPTGQTCGGGGTANVCGGGIG